MPKIILHTIINSSKEICFDLSRSIDLHIISTNQTNEKAIAGVTSGLINLHETVTWEAFHFGIKQQLTSQIVAFDYPNHFRDIQLKGIFKFFNHDHFFANQNDEFTSMTDVFEFESPMGILGDIANKLLVTRYMKKLLIERNLIIKEYAETEKYKLVI